MSNDIKKLEKILDYKFHNLDLLKKALTHKSFAAEAGISEFNERMEFLGDAILAGVVADYLYNKFPDQDEGRLSQLKSQIVSGHNLCRWAKELKTGDYIYISKSEEMSGGRKRDNLLSDSLEALIAAIYLDGGFEASRKFILGYLMKQKRLVVTDSKSKLQEMIQSKYKVLPEYKVMGESGPDHEKIFEVAVFLSKTKLGAGEGRSKKEAEQAAARAALRKINKKKRLAAEKE
jgi:ribonuclease-3